MLRTDLTNHLSSLFQHKHTRVYKNLVVEEPAGRNLPFLYHKIQESDWPSKIKQFLTCELQLNYCKNANQGVPVTMGLQIYIVNNGIIN